MEQLEVKFDCLYNNISGIEKNQFNFQGQVDQIKKNELALTKTVDVEKLNKLDAETFFKFESKTDI